MTASSKERCLKKAILILLAPSGLGMREILLKRTFLLQRNKELSSIRVWGSLLGLVQVTRQMMARGSKSLMMFLSKNNDKSVLKMTTKVRHY
jgi:hypothetical protein